MQLPLPPAVSLLLQLLLLLPQILTIGGSHFHISNVIIRSGSIAHHQNSFELRDIFNNLQPSKQIFEKENLEKCVESLRRMTLRTPFALKETIFSSADSFFNSLLAIIPIGLIYNIKQIRTVKLWIKSGLLTGLEWGKITAIYAGGEAFCKAIRGVDDRQNAYLGSGLASALLRINDGPVGMIQGFAIGYIFLIAVDSIMKHSDSSIALPVIEKHGDHGTSLATILFNHKGPAIKKPSIKFSKITPPRLPERANRVITTVRNIQH